MNKQEAKKAIIQYLNDNNISYKMLNESQEKIIDTEKIDTIYINTDNIEDVIGKRIETTLRFSDECVYCQSYYCCPITHTDDENTKAAKLINYINTHLHYDCDTLYEHSFFLMEEDGDIANGFNIRYELLELYFEETMNHILNFSVQQLSDVYIAVISYITGRSNYYLATKVAIDHEILGKPIPFIDD